MQVEMLAAKTLGEVKPIGIMCIYERTKEWIQERRESGNEKPYVMVVSLINPHDLLAYNNLEDWIRDPNRGGYPVRLLDGCRH